MTPGIVIIAAGLRPLAPGNEICGPLAASRSDPGDGTGQDRLRQVTSMAEDALQRSDRMELDTVQDRIGSTRDGQAEDYNPRR